LIGWVWTFLAGLAATDIAPCARLSKAKQTRKEITMEMKQVKLIYFSPTGTTQKVLGANGGQMGSGQDNWLKR